MMKAPLCWLLCGFGLMIWVGCSTPEPQGDSISITFRAQVGDKAFACGQTYEGVGADSAKIEPEDFRMFIHNIRLVTTDGKEVALTLKQDNKWQHQQLALLDFEDKKGKCAGGTEETRTVVEGTLPAGSYKGLRFILGVPFALNHINALEAPAPLNVTAMFWGWALGYKFLRVDVSTETKDGFIFHLGSINCQMDSNKKVSNCEAPNRPEIKLDTFEPGKSVVIADLAGLFAKTNLNQNAKDTPGGCMSTPDDTDCQSTFNSVGLAFGSQKDIPEQQFFRLGAP